MASFNLFVFLLLLLLLQPLSAMSDFFSPFLSPGSDEVCKDARCGIGRCKAPTNSSSFPFQCECDDGWKQTPSEADDNFKFLPCIYPNCSLNTSCSKTSFSAQVKTRTAIGNLFNPCDSINCGDGTCNRTSTFSYSCNCNAGYYNLLNSSAFPCYKECAIGMECSALGITLKNSSTTATSIVNEGSSILRGMSFWVVMLFMSDMVHLNQIDY